MKKYLLIAGLLLGTACLGSEDRRSGNRGNWAGIAHQGLSLAGAVVDQTMGSGNNSGQNLDDPLAGFPCYPVQRELDMLRARHQTRDDERYEFLRQLEEFSRREPRFTEVHNVHRRRVQDLRNIVRDLYTAGGPLFQFIYQRKAEAVIARLQTVEAETAELLRMAHDVMAANTRLVGRLRTAENQVTDLERDHQTTLEGLERIYNSRTRGYRNTIAQRDATIAQRNHELAAHHSKVPYIITGMAITGSIWLMKSLWDMLMQGQSPKQVLQELRKYMKTLTANKAAKTAAKLAAEKAAAAAATTMGGMS